MLVTRQPRPRSVSPLVYSPFILISRRLSAKASSRWYLRGKYQYDDLLFTNSRVKLVAKVDFLRHMRTYRNFDME
jgi:hypothetical protein